MSTSTVTAASRLLGQPRFLDRLDLPRRLVTAAAGSMVLIVTLMLGFVTWNGIQIFLTPESSAGSIFSSAWQPLANPASFGLLPFVTGTLAVTLLAVAISTPLSVGLALFLAEVAPVWARAVVQPALEIFVGIPSVVYGWLGITILVPWLRENFSGVGFTVGFSWLAGSLVLTVMILPTITSIAYDAFRAVPGDLRAASLALGTTRWQTIRHVLLPASAAGVLTAVILGMTRAAGEALAVQMVIGNRPTMPTGLSQPLSTLTSQITLDMGNTVAGEPWNQALWTMSLVLLLIAVGFVLLVRWLNGRRQTF